MNREETREETIERLIAKIKTLTRAQQIATLVFIDGLQKEYSGEPAAAPATQEQKYPDMVTNPEYYIDMLQGGK